MMRIRRIVVASLLIAAATSSLITPDAKAERQGLAFETVSIKPITADFQRSIPDNVGPDGRVSLRNITPAMLIGRAYGESVSDVTGVPEWARTAYYNIDATSPLSRATGDDVITMLRAMLADRFKLSAHTELREQPVYELVLARRDGKLGPGIKPSEADCESRAEADSQPERPSIGSLKDSTPPAPCAFRALFLGGTPFGSKADVFEGDTTMANFIKSLRAVSGRFVVDRTGLTGYYRLKMTFDRFATVRGPDVADAGTSSAPGVFTAIREQLGLELRATRAPLPVLVVDRLERPTEN